MADSLLKGLKVVELASVLAGPAVGMFFAELGADVIKIEHKENGGDITRKWKLPSEDKTQDYSAYYCSVNWNKEVLMLDLKTAKDKEKVYELIRNADIVISNFKTTSAKKMGMDYEQLKQLNPSLIFGLISAYGEDNPSPAFDVVLQAEAGFLYMNGEADGPPVKMPVALIDLLAAHQLKEAILLALIKRYQTGKGAKVSVSLAQAALASLANQATNWLIAGHIPQRMGCQHPNIAPYGEIVETQDGAPLILAIGTDRQFVQLCKGLQIPLAEHHKTNSGRLADRANLYAILKTAFSKFNKSEILPLLKQSGVPIGLIQNMKEVFESPLSKGMLLEETMPDGQVSTRVRTVVFDYQEG